MLGFVVYITVRFLTFVLPENGQLRSGRLPAWDLWIMINTNLNCNTRFILQLHRNSICKVNPKKILNKFHSKSRRQHDVNPVHFPLIFQLTIKPPRHIVRLIVKVGQPWCSNPLSHIVFTMHGSIAMHGWLNIHVLHFLLRRCKFVCIIVSGVQILTHSDKRPLLESTWLIIHAHETLNIDIMTAITRMF